MKKETLRQYLTYNKNSANIEGIFMGLDSQLKYLHKQGFYVDKLNSDSIILENNGYSSDNNVVIFSFSSIAKCHDKENEKHDNIVDLAKLAIGTYISIDNGFCDYSVLDISHIREYFNDVKWVIPNNEYYENVIVNDDTSMYYNDYIKQNGNSKNNSIQKLKATNLGKLYGNEEDAFVRIIFYPVVIVSFIIVAILLYIIFH